MKQPGIARLFFFGVIGLQVVTAMVAFLMLGSALETGALPPEHTAVEGQRQESQASLAPLRDEDARVESVAYRMGIAAVPWCTRLVPLPGWVLHHLAEYDAPLRPDLIAVYGLDRGPGVVAVAPGSAAERAGLAPGDTIISINGMSLADFVPAAGASRRPSRAPGTRMEAEIERLLASGPAQLSLMRNGNPLQVTLDAPKGCPARVRIASARIENAFADGDYATFSSRLVAVARSEDELAAIVGHELAHNFLNHAIRRRSGADRRPKREQEAEADLFGLRLMAIAGYDPRAAVTVWKRVLDANLLDSLGLSMHPPKGERIKALEAELAAIDASPGTVSWNGISIARPGATLDTKAPSPYSSVGR